MMTEADDRQSPTCAADELFRIQLQLADSTVSDDGVSWFSHEKLMAGLRVLVVEEERLDDPLDWYFLGDIHGDFFALHTCVEFIKAQSPNFKLIFLGDLIDRGPHSAECFVYMLNLAKAYPGRISWIAGNHDVGLHRLASGEFHSSVSPSEFIEVLNGANIKIANDTHLGDAFIRTAALLPRAMILPTGLFVTHGGVPHTDLQKSAMALVSSADKLTWLNTSPCLQDLTWTRITRFPKKLPNRESTGCSYGFLDFKSFADVMSGAAQIAALVTGHEHPAEGFDQHDSWIESRALTLTGFGFGTEYTDSEAFREQYRNSLFVGRLGTSVLPETVHIPVDRIQLEDFFQRTLASRFNSSLHEK